MIVPLEKPGGRGMRSKDGSEPYLVQDVTTESVPG